MPAPGFRRGDLIDALLMPTACKDGLQPQFQDLVRETKCDDPAAHREHIRVVVLARKAGGEEIVAERGADAWHLVGGNLLALAASAQDDAPVSPPVETAIRDWMM